MYIFTSYLHVLLFSIPDTSLSFGHNTTQNWTAVTESYSSTNSTKETKRGRLPRLNNVIGFEYLYCSNNDAHAA